MRIIQAGVEILTGIDENDIYRRLERIGRVCYKSENAITEESGEKFIRNLVKREHEAMLEHAHLSVLFTVDRGISHEIVRHRIASFAQESTRYCNYSQDKFGNEITVIEPCFFSSIPEEEKRLCRIALDHFEGENYDKVADFLHSGKITNRQRAYARWYEACEYAEHNYFSLLSNGCTPQEARDVLPTSVKTELVMTANLREWRHFLKLRAAGTTGAPHPQMREVAAPLLKELQQKLPAVFDDITLTEE